MADSAILPLFPQDTSNPVAAMGFDFGNERIGVAFGQSITGSAQPVTILKARDGQPQWDSLAELIAKWRPTVLVVGLPYHLDGTDSPMLLRANRFGWRLHGRMGLPVYGMDERLSSREALEMVMDRSANRTQPAIDHLAAQVILENWLAGYSRR